MRTPLPHILFALFLAVAGLTHAAEGTSNSADLRFIDEMKSHHSMATDMAKMAVEKAADKRLRKLAAKMAADQQKDIAKLDAWRKKWFADAQASPSPVPSMDMSALQQTTGAQFDQRFIEQMVAHHERGIKMSEEAMPNLQRPQLKTFARTTIAKQRKEIGKMEALKKS